MKKVLSALLIATLLAASVLCAFAVAAEEGDTDPIQFNFLSAVKSADTDDATIVVNEDGSVTVTLKRDASGNPIVLVESYENGKVDLTSDAYLVISFETTGNPGDTDFLAHYTRVGNDTTNPADNFFSGAKGNTANVYSSTDTSVVWNVSAYLGERVLEDGNEYLDLAIANGAAGDVITIFTYVISNDPTILEADEDNSSDDGSSDDESSDAESSDEETSDVESSDEETSDVESSDEETSDVESSDEETSDVESSDEETSDVESSDEETSDVESSDEETSDVESSDEESSDDSAVASADESSEESSSAAPASSSEAPASSNSPATGDAGMIVFAILAVLSVAGAVVAVRVRH